MKIYIGSDHAGFTLKEAIKQKFGDRFAITDFGPHGADRVDYPDYAIPVATAVAHDADALGILICGTGIGMSIAANKVYGIRAALVYNVDTGRLAREHNNANIICLGAREASVDDNFAFIEAFLGAQFLGDRHTERLEKIMTYEKNHRL